jgi:hypothetical protein
LICTPTIEGKRHFGLFRREGVNFSLQDVSTEYPQVSEAMRTALEKWMDEHVETPLEQIFPGGE